MERISPLSERTKGYSSCRKLEIKRHFKKYGQGCSAVIDKTPGNLFRVKNVIDVFPDAVFIFVVRNPLDNINSRRRLLVASQGRFQAIFRLIKHFKTITIRGNLPITRLPFFIIDQCLLLILRWYFSNNLLGKMERVDGQVEAFRLGGTDAVFVNQLLKSEEEFRKIEGSHKVIMVRYEDLHLDAINESLKVADFLSMSDEETKKLSRYIQENRRLETVKLRKNIQSTVPNLPYDWQCKLEEYMDRLEYMHGRVED